MPLTEYSFLQHKWWWIKESEVKSPTWALGRTSRRPPHWLYSTFDASESLSRGYPPVLGVAGAKGITVSDEDQRLAVPKGRIEARVGPFCFYAYSGRQTGERRLLFPEVRFAPLGPFASSTPSHVLGLLKGRNGRGSGSGGWIWR